MKKFFPVFKVGKYPQGEYTEDDLREVFENYDPAWQSAPFSTDHKKDGPALGYAETLKFENGTLYASIDDMNPTLREAVKKKNFGRVSIEMYKDLPGKGRYLKAISFLGVRAPQVKGLEGEIRSIEFKEGESEEIAFDANFDTEEEVYELGDVVAEAETEEEKEETSEAAGADKTPDSDTGTDSDSRDAGDPEADQPDPDEEDPDDPDEGTDDAPAAENFEELQGRIEKLEEEKQTLESKFQQTEAERKQAQERLGELEVDLQKNRFEQWLNERIAFGSVPPAQKDKIMELLMALDSVDEFEDQADRPAPLEMFQDFVENLPKVIDETEKVIKGDQEEQISGSENIAREARKYRNHLSQEEGRVISFAEAVHAVEKGLHKQTEKDQ